eukprot:scaffold156937_cov50-Prasinocladus_malaysianus.AAC.3
MCWVCRQRRKPHRLRRLQLQELREGLRSARGLHLVATVGAELCQPSQGQGAAADGPGLGAASQGLTPDSKLPHEAKSTMSSAQSASHMRMPSV